MFYRVQLYIPVLLLRTLIFPEIRTCETANELGCVIQDDSLSKGPTEVYLQIFNESVSQLTDDEPTTGYYQQDGATRHTSNASMREIESFFLKTE